MPEVKLGVFLSLRYNQPFDRIVDRCCVLGPPDQCAELPRHLEVYARAVVPRVRAALN